MIAIIIAFLVYINIANILNVALYAATDLAFFVDIMPAAKDMFFFFILFIVMLYLMKKKTIDKSNLDLFALAFFMLLGVGISFVVSPASLSFKIFNARRILEMYLIVLTFSLLPISAKSHKILIKTIVYIGVFVALFGFLEMVLPISFWDSFLQLPKFWQAGDYESVSWTSIWNARGRTSDLRFLIGRDFRRMFSTYAEATMLGIFFSFLATYIAFSKKFKYKNYYFLLFTIAALLVFSKAFLVSLFVIAIYKIIRKPSLYPFFLISGTFLLAGFIVATSLGKVHGSLSHLMGFYTGIELLLDKPLGFGLGMSGNRGMLNFPSMGTFGTESGIGNVFAQTGIVGFISLVFFITILKKFRKLYYITYNEEYFAIFVVAVNWFLTYLFSVSSLGFTGNAVVFVFIGLFLSSRMKNDI